MISALGSIRHDWKLSEVEALFALPFMDLVFEAQRIHRANHEPNTVQTSTLLSIKTGRARRTAAIARRVCGTRPGWDARR